MKNLEIAVNTPPTVEELTGLFAQADWARGRTADRIRQCLARPGVVVTVRRDGRLIGFGRALTDGVFRALIDDVIVDEAHRGQGVGAAIVDALLGELHGVEEVFLHTGEHLQRFYAAHGFERCDGLTMVKRQP